MTGLDSLSFDLDGCVLRQEGPGQRLWMNGDGVAHLLRYSDTPPAWTFDLTQPSSASEFYGQQCASMGGAMLSLAVTAAGGREALAGLFKYRAPVEGSLAMYFVGIIWVPFQTCTFQINVEAVETGTTGLREAAVMLAEPDSQPLSFEPPVVVSSAEELFAKMRSKQLSAIPADDERWDQSFPDHPLSRVRARLSRVSESLRFADDTRSLAAFRLG